MGKDKAAAKKAALKKRLAKKLKGGKAAKTCAVVALLALVGCSTADPASRLTKATVGDVVIRQENCSNCSPRINLGDLAFASADSDGSTETTTASPSNTVSPSTDLNLNKAAGGGLGSLVGSAVKAVCGGGECADCESGECEYCEDCEYKP